MSNRIILPKGLKRVPIVKKSKSQQFNEKEYTRRAEADYERHRATYRTIFIYDVPVKVKVGEVEE